MTPRGTRSLGCRPGLLVAAALLVPALLLAEGRGEPASPSTAGAQPPSAPAPDPCSEQVLAPLRARVEQLRGFRFSRPVPCRVENGAALAAKLRSEWDRKSPAEWEAVEARFHHFGLLPPGTRLKEALLPVLDEQVAAYYDNVTKTLAIIRRDGDPLADEADLGGLEALAGAALPQLEEMTLLHELDHALVDQRADLAAALDRRRGQNDAENALVALTEGEAVWTMMAGLVESIGGTPEDLGDPGLDESLDRMEGMLAGAVGGGALANAPPAIRESLLFPYLRGFRFARALSSRGGRALLEAAAISPPETTHSILHPESWGVAPEQIVRFEWPSDDPFLAAGWAFLEDDTYGEQDLALLVSPDAIEHGRSSTAEWRGDRWRLYREAGGGTAAAGITEWGDDTAARIFEAAIRDRLGHLRGSGTASVTTPGRTPRRDPIITRLGRVVVVVDGAPWSLAEQVTARLLQADSFVETCPSLAVPSPAPPGPAAITR